MITLLWRFVSQSDALLQREQSIRRSITYHVCRDSTTYHAVVTLLHITLLWRDQSIWRSIAKRTANSTLYYISRLSWFYYMSRCRDSITYHVAVTRSINSTLYYTTLPWRDQSIRRSILYFCQWLLRRFFDLVDLKSLFINCTLVVGSTTRSFDVNIWLVVQLSCTSMKSRKSSQQSLTKKSCLSQSILYISMHWVRGKVYSLNVTQTFIHSIQSS